jgi:hypothetical protein
MLLVCLGTVVDSIVGQRLSVRETEILVKNMKNKNNLKEKNCGRTGLQKFGNWLARKKSGKT